jgi:hypothetical protein
MVNERRQGVVRHWRATYEENCGAAKGNRDYWRLLIRFDVIKVASQCVFQAVEVDNGCLGQVLRGRARERERAREGGEIGGQSGW